MTNSTTEETVDTVEISNQNDDGPRRISVQLPNLFSATFGLTPNPHLNPFLERTTQESEAWLEKLCSIEAKKMQKIHDHNFVYFSAVFAPEAPEEEFRTMSDWMCWIFAFDDMFDEGHLRGNITPAKDMRDSLLATMSTPSSPGPLQPVPAIIQAHADIWIRLHKKSSPGIQQRYADTMSSYINNVIHQLEAQNGSKLLTVDELLEERRDTIGVKPLNALGEYCYGLRIPDEVFEHWTIKELQRLACELVAIQNEIVSYRKEEEADAVPHNLVGILRHTGMTAQEAFDSAGSMLESRYRSWSSALAMLPSWGDSIDQEVQIYIGFVKNQVLANANWSFVSRRYFGAAQNVVRKTLTTDVLLDPAWNEVKGKVQEPTANNPGLEI